MITVINNDHSHAVSAHSFSPPGNEIIVPLSRPESLGMRGLWCSQNCAKPLVISDLGAFLHVLLPARSEYFYQRS
jgi:hypothetical protein